MTVILRRLQRRGKVEAGNNDTVDKEPTTLQIDPIEAATAPEMTADFNKPEEEKRRKKRERRY